MFEDHYKTLEIPRDASKEDIKKAYKRLAMKYHPDRNGGDPEFEKKFRKVAEAYSALSEGKGDRGVYDRPYKSPFKRYSYSDDNKESSFKPFWETIEVAPKIINISIDITLKEAVIGCDKEVEYSFEDICKKCNPKISTYKGASFDRTDLAVCSVCFGSGKTKQGQGYVTIFSTCRNCGGTGHVKAGNCSKCNNTRKIVTQVRSKLKIPPGVISGNILRLAGSNNVITMAKINVENSKEFKRKGNDIHSTLSISLKEALLGSSKKVRLLRRECGINIPECIQSGTKIRVKGEGACSVGKTNFGDHYIEINIKIPKKLTELQKKAAEDLPE